MDKLNSTGKVEEQYMNIKQKRIYDEILVTDGKRILLDRLWPRGIKKEVAQLKTGLLLLTICRMVANFKK